MTLSNRKVPYKLRLHTCKVRLKDLKKIKNQTEHWDGVNSLQNFSDYFDILIEIFEKGTHLFAVLTFLR